MTFKSFLSITFLLIASVSVVPFAANAQTSHEGHDHAEGQHPPAAPLPDIDYVFTESPDDRVIGAENAPVTIIAYASVTCPHCGHWFSVGWPKFKADHIDTGHVRFVMREFPTSPVNLARAGFAIIGCAPEDEYFIHLIDQMQSQDKVFKAMESQNLEPVYQAFAKKAGMATQDDMYACFGKKDVQDRINRAVMRAQAGGINSVPSFIMDGQFVKGDNSAAGLSSLVMKKLSGGVSAPMMPEKMTPEAMTTSPMPTPR